MNIKKSITSSTFRSMSIGLGVLCFALLIFQMGVSIGYKRALYTHRFTDTFRDTFGPRQQHMMRDPRGFDVPGGHGVAGKIVSVALPQIVVAGPDGIEQTVTIDTDTVIKNMRDTVAVQTLAVGDMVVVFGVPDADGSVHAKIIREMPDPIE